MKASDAKTHLDVIQWVVQFYSPPNWNEEKTEGYMASIGRVPLPLVAASVKTLVEKHQWMPSLAEWLDILKPAWNALLERERSQRLLLTHQAEKLDLRAAVKEAAWDGNEFAESLAKKWKL